MQSSTTYKGWPGKPLDCAGFLGGGLDELSWET